MIRRNSFCRILNPQETKNHEQFIRKPGCALGCSRVSGVCRGCFICGFPPSRTGLTSLWLPSALDCACSSTARFTASVSARCSPHCCSDGSSSFLNCSRCPAQKLFVIGFFADGVNAGEDDPDRHAAPRTQYEQINDHADSCPANGKKRISRLPALGIKQAHKPLRSVRPFHLSNLKFSYFPTSNAVNTSESTSPSLIVWGISMVYPVLV